MLGRSIREGKWLASRQSLSWWLCWSILVLLAEEPQDTGAGATNCAVDDFIFILIVSRQTEWWEPGAVRGKIEQRDGFAISIRHLEIFGKIFGRRIVEGDLFAVHHVRRQQRSEDLGDGSN